MFVLAAPQTYSVDIFSMGCVFFYVLTGGSHPFGENPFRRQSNILTGEYDLQKVSSNPRGAHDLIRTMISTDPAERPPLTAVLTHPLFWSNDKALGFFLDVSDRVEKESEDTFPLLRRVEAGAGELWNPNVVLYYTTLPCESFPNSLLIV